ncbi:MAG: N-acetylmuramoyl-L-alanine amidase [Saprospiraceae bacterium]|nr:N-acetylmuramoyl-L-alanine amidase [Saprospiraceae bacterium]
MLADYCVYLDAGHGAIDENGKYVTAPNKQFEHSKGAFHNGKWFYEGVWNRKLTNRVAAKLKNLGISHLIVSHEYLDLSLAYRVDVANWHHKNYKKGIFISNHANASGAHSARGFEVYTTPGTTKSDALAEMHWKNVDSLLGDKIKMRPGTSDGDQDKEANFYVIKYTSMPAMLVEHLFFDNYDDAMLLMDDEILEKFAEAQVRTIIDYFNSLS